MHASETKIAIQYAVFNYICNPSTGCPKKVPLEISSSVVKRTLSCLWEFSIASKTNRQFN